MQEQRLTLRLRSFWDLTRKTQEIPDIRHFNTASIEDLWPFCILISIGGTSAHPTFKYEYMGEPLIELYGHDLTHQQVEKNSSEFPGMVIHKKLEEALRKRQPMLDAGHFITRRGQMIKYRACFLPFSNQGGTLTHIVVGLTYRVF